MPAFQKLPRRHPVKHKRQTKITIPSAAVPHAKLVFAEMSRQNVTYDEVEAGSGVLRSTLKAWRHKNRPGLESIEAVLGFLGWDFVPVPRANVLPRALLDDLVPIAERHGLTMPKTIEAIVEIVAGIHDGLPPPRPHEEVLDGFGKGDVLIGASAVAAGMADALGTFESVLADLAAGLMAPPVKVLPPPRRPVAAPSPSAVKSVSRERVRSAEEIAWVEAEHARLVSEIAVAAILEAGSMAMRLH